MAQWLSWLERRPVTAEVESSSLFWVVSNWLTNLLIAFYGILAQLGEHLPYKQRVIGSSPIGSICRSGGTGRRTGHKILRDLYSRTGSIPVCGMILSERNVDFTAFLSLFCLLDIFAEKIKQMRISMLDQ